MRNFGFLNSSFVLLCLFYFNSLIGFANESTVLADSSKKEEKGIDIIVVGGLGLTTSGPFQVSSTWGWSDEYKIGPSALLGIEVPFTKSHIFALQVYANGWYAKSAKDNTTNGDASGFSVSAILKYYLGKKNKKIRGSLHLGIGRGVEVGYAIYYSIDNQLRLSFNRRFIIPHLDPGGNSSLPAPCLLIFNLDYKFNLEI